jgi:hypothetical protein
MNIICLFIGHKLLVRNNEVYCVRCGYIRPFNVDMSRRHYFGWKDIEKTPCLECGRMAIFVEKV